jgi:phospholipase C
VGSQSRGLDSQYEGTAAPAFVFKSRGLLNDRPRRESSVAILLAVLILMTSLGTAVVVNTGPARSPLDRIDHLVFVVMENRAYDTYFGTYCQELGPNCSGIAGGLPPNTCVPLDPSSPANGCVRPFNFSGPDALAEPNLPHGWVSSHEAYQNGSMDGFYQAENHTTETFGHLNGSTIPTYWDIAQEFGLGDSFFSSQLSFSLPNHWHLVAGSAPAIFNGPMDFVHNATTAHTYLNEANQTPTVEDLLQNSTVSWKYYDYGLNPTYQAAINGTIAGVSALGAFDFWNPMAAKAESYTASLRAHFVNTQNFFGDVSGGTLPQVSWLIPKSTESDHPPANVTDGERFVASAVDSVESSAYWNSTAIFVFWDDYGGFYDHVIPPQLPSIGLGFRVPLLVVSPYTPHGEIVHQFTYFDSMLRLVEWRFGLPCLTVADCSAPLPLGFFDFSMTPRAPVLFTTDVINATYPISGTSFLTTFSGAPASVLTAQSSADPSLAD